MPLSDMGTEREGERARRWPLMANRVLIVIRARVAGQARIYRGEQARSGMRRAERRSAACRD